MGFDGWDVEADSASSSVPNPTPNDSSSEGPSKERKLLFDKQLLRGFPSGPSGFGPAYALELDRDDAIEKFE